MKAVIFTGPSLSHDDAKKILGEAECSPPVKRGDVLTAFEKGARIIGIIDGVFHQDVAVSPREILGVLRKGCVVVGGSSMGALRAVELDGFGMIGVGEIYRMYKSGEIDSDDEIAVVFNPVTFEPLSEPLVNIRWTFKKMVEKELLLEDLAANIIEIARKLHYSKRSYDNILNEAVKSGIISAEEAKKLRELILRHSVNLKRLDAIKVVEKVKQILEAQQ